MAFETSAEDIGNLATIFYCTYSICATRIGYGRLFWNLMLCLHYVPGGHGSHDFCHRGRNGVTVAQRRGTGSTNVARRGCRDLQDRLFNSPKNCHGSHGGIDLLKCAVVERGDPNKNVTERNRS